MSSPDVNFPKPSPQEEALQQEQVSILRQQRDVLSQQMREQQLLAPILFQRAGIEPIMVNGQLVGFKETADELTPLRQQIEKGLLERSRAALAGELPIDPTLRRELGEQEASLNERLRKDLGPGYDLSTAGSQRLADFGKRKAELFAASSRGDLTLSEQLGLARQGANQNSLDAFLARISGLENRDLLTAEGLGRSAAGFQNPLGNLFANRQGIAQARSVTESLQAQRANAWIGVLGSLVGGAGQGAGSAAGAAAFASTARVKKAIEPLDKDEYRRALRKVRETPVTRWRYRWESDDRTKHIGPILELSPKEILADDAHISIGDYLGLQHAALKGLDREVTTLRQMMRRRG